MSSLWTPSGEHEPERTDQPRTDGGFAAGYEGQGEPGAEELEAEMRRARDELSSVPVVDIIANHAVGIWQLAVLHLTPDPAPDGTPTEPRLEEAGLAIDALGALVEGLGERLHPNDEPLRDALTQLRMA
ncbi:MAG TPA: hypothetical protein VFZ17_07870, partial [Acidimicrobiia bacterium]|nr:hypothetical protein [Acidimicrobiia bacterium]